MRELFIILKYHAVEIKNVLLTDKKRVFFWLFILMSPLILLGGATSFYAFFRFVLKGVPVEIVLNSMSFGLFVLFGFTASVNIFMTMKMLFNSNYFECLLPLPISGFAHFALKVVEMVFRNYFDVMFTIPSAVAVSAIFGLRAVYWPAVILFVLLLEVMVSLLSMIAILAITRIFSKRGADSVVWIFNVVFVLLFIFIQNYPASLLDKSAKNSAAAVEKFAAFFSSGYFDLLPTKWFVNVVYHLSRQEIGPAAINYGYFLLLLFAVGATAWRLFDRGFRVGWQVRDEITAPGGSYKSRVHGVAYSLVKKEALAIMRNNQLIYSILIMPVVFVIFVLSGIAFGDMNEISFLVFITYISMLSSTLFSFGLEGNGINFIKTLPIPLEVIYWTKYAVYTSINLVISLSGYAMLAFMGKIPRSVGHLYILVPFVFGIMWFNMIVLDAGFCFANYKGSSSNLKDAVTMEGTLFITALVMIIIFAIVSAGYFDLANIFFYLKLLTLAIIAAQWALHYGGVRKYQKGEF